MPLISLTTNISPAEPERQQVLTDLSRSAAEMLGKSENYVMVKAQFSVPMLFAGSSEPAAYLECKSIGLPEQQTAAFSDTLCSILAGSLGIPAKRVYIEFSNAQRHLWGWDGRTFA